MELIVGNIIYILTDLDVYVRLDQIGFMHSHPSPGGLGNFDLIGIVSGKEVALASNKATKAEVETERQFVIDAQAKYAPVLNLCVRYDIQAGKKQYSGSHSLINPPTNNPNWTIRKFTWGGQNIVLEQGPLVGAWDDRAALEWT